MQETQISIDHSNFLEEVISFLQKKPLETPSLFPFEDVSVMTHISEAKKLANALIDANGVFDYDLLLKLIEEKGKNLYSIDPLFSKNAIKQDYLYRALLALKQDHNLIKLISKMQRPERHKIADDLIRETIDIANNTPITDVHAKRAALSAFLTQLRQNVGSCFATAPALIVQQEHPEYFLKDIDALFSTGRLKRVVEGKEYSAPIAISTGHGDLKRPLLLLARNSEQFQKLASLKTLQAAFLELNIYEPSLLEKGIKEFLERRFAPSLERKEEVVVTVEDILSEALLEAYKLKASDLEDFRNRPQEIVTQLVMVSPKSSELSRGKGELCQAYFQGMERARKRFKQFTENALLKAWEFTLASFAETKATFSSWNMYASLGFDPKEPEGIGAFLSPLLQERLEAYNQKMNNIQEEYKAVYNQLLLVEGRLRSASTEQELRWIRADYQAKRNEFNVLEELRDKEHEKGNKLAGLLNLIIESYEELFPVYFQEVYDPDMLIRTDNIYDDSPAGFRLFYKHGRQNTSQWTPIYTLQQFIEALNQFFVATERELEKDPRVAGIERDLSDMITALISHIRTKEFLESAFDRMAKIHGGRPIKDPLDNLDKIEKKPWAYTSGGTMSSLVSCYFARPDPPTEASTWVESPTELLVFLADIAKRMDDTSTSEKRSALMHSPTHAFRILPNLPVFKQIWKEEAFTYTWIRDHLIEPAKQICSNITLDAEMMQALLDELKKKLPEFLRYSIDASFSHLPYALKASDFRDYFFETLRTSPSLTHIRYTLFSPEEIDEVLFRCLPFCLGYQLEETLKAIFQKLPFMNDSLLEKLFKELESRGDSLHRFHITTAERLRKIAIGLIALVTKKTSFPYDLYELVGKAAQEVGAAYPAPILFADSNWEKTYFGFVVNPSTLLLEFWSLDYAGLTGNPMPGWKEWLNGSKRQPTWGVYTRPKEYS